MPEFTSPFSVLSLGRKVSKEELIRCIRYFIAAENEAIQLYMQIAEATEDEVAKEVLIDIANEEKVHAGEFLRLLYYLDPDEKKYHKEGFKEVEEIMEDLGCDEELFCFDDDDEDEDEDWDDFDEDEEDLDYDEDEDEDYEEDEDDEDEEDEDVKDSKKK